MLQLYLVRYSISPTLLLKMNLVVVSNINWHISFQIYSQYFYDYINVISDDHSRVILSSTRNDYINANIIRVCEYNSHLHIDQNATLAFLNLTKIYTSLFILLEHIKSIKDTQYQYICKQIIIISYKVKNGIHQTELIVDPIWI